MSYIVHTHTVLAATFMTNRLAGCPRFPSLFVPQVYIHSRDQIFFTTSLIASH